MNLIEVLTTAVLVLTLIYSSVVDVRQRIIPNKALLVILICWLVHLIQLASTEAATGAAELAHISLWQSLALWTQQLCVLMGASLLSACIMGLILFVAQLLCCSTCAHARTLVGAGDIKLLLLLAAYLQLPLSGYMLLLACIAGVLSAVLVKNRQFPWGPAISLACILILIGQSAYYYIRV